MKAFDHFLKLLVEVQKLRSANQKMVYDEVEGLTAPSWVLLERKTLLDEINQQRLSKSWPPLDEQVLVRKVERQACGHIDYTRKMALYSIDLVDHKNPNEIPSRY